MTAALDHGILNVPLSKRVGDIDAQIDRYRADQARAENAAAKAEAAQTRADRVTAKDMLSRLPASRIAEIARNIGSTPAKVKSDMKSMAYYTPAKVIAMLAKEALQ